MRYGSLIVKKKTDALNFKEHHISFKQIIIVTKITKVEYCNGL